MALSLWLAGALIAAPRQARVCVSYRCVVQAGERGLSAFGPQRVWHRNSSGRSTLRYARAS
eukprot:scaffold30196_cov68-Phaeocystis_antarctica.AAC.1